MRIVNLSPQDLELIADDAEDEAYKNPPGEKRQALLMKVYAMRSRANIAKWLGEAHIRTEIL
jgi:hypothetical protein